MYWIKSGIENRSNHPEPTSRTLKNRQSRTLKKCSSTDILTTLRNQCCILQQTVNCINKTYTLITVTYIHTYNIYI